MADEAPETVTIPKSQLGVFQRGMALLNQLNGDARSQPLLEQAIKVHHPEVTTEEERLQAQVQPHLKPVLEGIEAIKARFAKEDEDKAARDQAAVESEITTAFERLAQTGYTEDGLGKIKQLMVDRKIADPEAAAALFDRLNPATTVGADSYTPQTWDLAAAHGGALGDHKLLFENPDAWTEKAIPQVLSEIRSGR